MGGEQKQGRVQKKTQKWGGGERYEFKTGGKVKEVPDNPQVVGDLSRLMCCLGALPES